MGPFTPNRRALLGMTLSAAAVAALGACQSGAKTSTTTPAANQSGAAKSLFPTYVPAKVPTPEFAGDGKIIEPGYTSYPKELVTSVPTKPGKGGSYTATVMYWGDPMPAPTTYTQAMDEAMGAKLAFESIPAESYTEKVTAKLSTGTGLTDILEIPNWEVPPKLFQVYDKLFADLTDYISGDKIKAYPNLANLPSAAWRGAVWGGRLFAIPVPIAMVTYATFMRADLMRAKNVKAPTSGAELKEFGKAMTNAAQNRYAFGNPLDTVTRMYGLGGTDWMPVDGKMMHQWESDRYPQMLEYTRALVAAGYVHPEIMAGTGDAKAFFLGGKVAMYSAGYDVWNKFIYPTQDPSMEPGFECAALVPFGVDGGPAKVIAGGATLFMSFLNAKLTKDQITEILGMLNFMAAPFGTKEFELATMGKVGVHHTMVNGSPTKTPQGEKELGQNYNIVASAPRVDYNAAYPNWVKARHAWTTAVSAMATPSPTAGVFVDVPARLQAADTKVNDGVKDIINGRRPVSDWAGLVATWKSEAGDQVRELYVKGVAAMS